MRLPIAAVRNIAGLVFGFVFGLILTSPTVSALSMIPGLSILSPTDNSNVSGTITFYAAADSEGLVSLQFKLDGQDYGSLITAGACRASFDTRTTTDGPHTIQALGTDQYGNTVLSQPSTVFVNNLAPAIAGIGVSNITSSSATITWMTAADADGRVDYGTTMSYGGSAYDGTPTISHTMTLTGLGAGTTYHFRAVSVGLNGILSSSGDFVFATSGAPAPAPTPTPTPGPAPTPTPSPRPSPTPTPSPGPSPSPTPEPPTAQPAPSPTPTSTSTRGGGRTPTHNAQYTGTAVPRIEEPTSSPTPVTQAVGQGTTRGALSASREPGGAVLRATGAFPMLTAGYTGASGSTGSTGSTGSIGSTGSSGAAPTTVQTQFSNVQRVDSTPCAGPDPFLNDGGGLCVNGTWVRNDAGAAGAAGSTGSTSSGSSGSAGTTGTDTEVVKSAPAVQGATGTATTSTTTAPAKAKAPTSSCSTPDPFAATGGVGLCVNGEWVLLWKPIKR